MTGMREQEVMHCSWEDVNLPRGTVTVRYKPQYRFSPKGYKEREVPIPAKLIKSLKMWKAKSDSTCGLVFPTAGCRPKLDFLDCLKVVAERAKLDKEKFWLHKFRATFATWSLWAGVDLRTVQQWLGHSDMESTMRYLKPSRSQEVRDKINETFPDRMSLEQRSLHSWIKQRLRSLPVVRRDLHSAVSRSDNAELSIWSAYNCTCS
jgi:integrase/recombinase XerD